MSDEHMHNEGVQEAAERVQMRREAERQETRTLAAGDAVLRSRLGDNYEQAARAIPRIIEKLTPEQRSQLGGSINDPEKMIELLGQALGPPPKTLAEAEAELAKARERMRDPKGGWHNDDLAQLRYRAVLQRLDKLPK